MNIRSTVTLRLLCLVLLVLLAWPGTAAANVGDQRHLLATGDQVVAAGESIIELLGPWELYWDQLLEPGQFIDNQAQASKVMLPHVWGLDGSEATAPDRQGHATYRLLVRFDGSDSLAVKALYIPGAATAYRLWINGRLETENGIVGTSREEMTPRTYAKVVYFEPVEGDNELVLQVSNYVQRKGGLWSKLYVGGSEEITHMRERRMTSQLLIAIVLLTLGLYHLALFALRKLDRLSLLIGLVSTLLAFRSLLLGDTLLVRFFPELPWELAVKVEYMAPYAGIPIFLLFVRRLYPQEVHAVLLRVMLVIGTAFTAIVWSVPAILFTYTMQPFQVYSIVVFLYIIYVFGMAAYRRRDGAFLNGIASLVMFAAVLNDILYYNLWFDSIDFAPYGVMFFIFVQTLIVALKFSKAYYKVESLSVELQTLNTSLEDRIKERTQELEWSNDRLLEANEQLKQAELSRQRLLANISHELGTPMTSIQGYLKAMLDGVVRSDDRSCQQLLYDKSVLVSRLVQDLFDLSKLESGQASFYYTSVTVSDLLAKHMEKFRLEVEAKQLSYVLQPPEAREQPGVPVVTIDPFRFEQVMGNLIHNALKHTLAGGAITISAQFRTNGNDAASSLLEISIADTGTGIDPSVLPYVFDRFVKGSVRAMGKQDGSGLGLAIVKEIVTIHGGAIDVASKPGEGAVFTFTLPVEWTAEK
ncbi:cell wall metabolism sensor histidine kinase WalK [Paenibacillus sp. YYML68]|uniref:sensor histidine kinase n=1 Tax=Paenibacillus sp. YYML68 TaxID=2909250 RepID=UPI002492E4D1|nr:sensor histidine kinase [Paenibacillus sp. YYML68]